MLKKYGWPLFFVLLGLSSIIAQIALLRELTSLFYGNELFYGLGLGAWMLFAGLGSLLATKIKLFQRPSAVWLVLGLSILLIPLIIIVLRVVISKAVPLGELPAPGLALAVLGIAFSLVCFFFGASFTWGVGLWQKRKGTSNLAYFYETLGLFLGGLFFSFVLSATDFPLTPKLNRQTLSWRYPNIQKVINSPYNQIIITQQNSQQSFFLNGQLAFTSQESLENKKLLSLIKPFTNQGKNVLVLGSPLLATDITKEFSSARVDFIEMDSHLLRQERKLLTPKISILNSDPRKYLNQTERKWDLVIYSPGNPQTLLQNRYFTEESFNQIKNHLVSRGIFALTFYLPTDYQSKEALTYGSSVYQTFKKIFPYLELINQEDQIILLGSDQKIEIKQDGNDYFQHQLNQPQRKEILAKFISGQGKISTDLSPKAFLGQLLFWQTLFGPGLPRIFSLMVPLVILGLFFITLLSAFLKSLKYTLGIAMTASSFVLISLQTTILLIFQTKIGCLYRQISLLLAVYLLGMAAGIKLKAHLFRTGKNQATAWRFLFVFILIVLLLLPTKLANSSIFWLTISLVLGLFGGLFFATLNRLYLKKSNHPSFIYAFDLFGSSLGAILSGSLLLPFLGTEKLFLYLAGIILTISFVIAKRR